MQVRITCGPKLHEQAAVGVEKLLGKEFAATLMKALSDEKGRLYFDMLSTDRLSKPSVKIDTQRLLSRLLEGLGGNSLLESLMKKR